MRGKGGGERVLQGEGKKWKEVALIFFNICDVQGMKKEKEKVRDVSEKKKKKSRDRTLSRPSTTFRLF